MSERRRIVDPSEPFQAAPYGGNAYQHGWPPGLSEPQVGPPPPPLDPVTDALRVLKMVALAGRPIRGNLGSSKRIICPPFTGTAMPIPLVELVSMEHDGPGFACTIFTSQGPYGGSIGGAPLDNYNTGLDQMRVLMRIQVGGGSTQGAATEVMVVPAGIPVQVTGNKIYVQAGLFNDELGLQRVTTDLVSGNVGDSFQIAASAFINPGTSTNVMPTAVKHPPPGGIANGQYLLSGSCRIRQIWGYGSIANTGTTWLMFFDIPPGVGVQAGTLPVISIPVPVGGPFSLDFITSGRAFGWGCSWALSTTEDTFTADNASQARVDVEFYSSLRSTHVVFGND